MSKKVAFIGHRDAYRITDKLYNAIKNEIELGCNYFTMGTYGNFDEFALSACRELRQQGHKIRIEVVITSLNQIKPQISYDVIFGKDVYRPYSDVETVMYEIEMCHYKQKIIESNKRMIDSCDTLICYYDNRISFGGTRIAVKYAEKMGKQIINLFE